MINFDQLEQIEEALQDLWEDAALLRLALLGAQSSMDRLTLSCLLRVSDYLKQHIQDVEMLMEMQSKKPC